MGFRVVQRGSAPVVIGYLINPKRDAELREALPGLAIVMSTDAPPVPKMSELDAIRRMVDLPAAEVALIGYSAGCQSVRTFLRNGVRPRAVLTIDGTAANWPKPLDWQIDVWRQLAEEARRGDRMWVATCTQQTYTEHLQKERDGHDPFMATVHVLERVLDLPLPPGLEVHEGDLHVISYDSARMDGEAHIRQQSVVMMELVREYLAPYLLDDGEGPVTEPTQPSPPSWRDPRLTLGERAAILAIREMHAGVKEEPPGSNTSPRIREYLAPAHRNGKLLNLEAAEWCAAFACWCIFTALGPYSDRGTDNRRDDEVMPFPYSVSGVEIEEAAKRNGAFWPARSGYIPRRGDLAIYRRGSGRPEDEWKRHVTMVLDAPTDDGPDFTAIAGNESNTVAITKRKLTDTTLVGFVEMPCYRAATALDVA
jgi:hypothetical protein